MTSQMSPCHCPSTSAGCAAVGLHDQLRDNGHGLGWMLEDLEGPFLCSIAESRKRSVWITFRLQTDQPNCSSTPAASVEAILRPM